MQGRRRVSQDKDAIQAKEEEPDAGAGMAEGEEQA